ncbi:MAG: hypothetical protein NZ742_02585 [Acidobacteria bacterium]|nr:hypothetical protein [Acidobacteriota bacterium]MDW7983170.1 hypothetical protein [Acidobacteriota bacterium]
MGRGGWFGLRWAFGCLLMSLPGGAVGRMQWPEAVGSLLAGGLGSLGIFWAVEYLRLRWREGRPIRWQQVPAQGWADQLPWLLLLVPLGTTLDAWTLDDLRTRHAWALGTAAGLYFVLAWGPAVARRLAPYTGCLRPWHVGLGCLGLYSLMAFEGLFPTLGLTGDEPHYLIVTQSIFEDGDVNVYNNYQEQTYRRFLGPSAGPLAIHAWPGRAPNTWYSIHAPGLSVGLVPFYALAIKTGLPVEAVARGAMALVAAWAMAGLWALLRQIGYSPGQALVGTGVVGLSVPGFFLAYHLYPEMVAFGLMVWAFRWWWAGPYRPTRLLWAGGMVGLLIWLGLKYGAVLLIWSLLSLWRMRRPELRRPMMTFLIPVIVSLGLYEAWVLDLYGQANPLASYMGGNRREETWANVQGLLRDTGLWRIRGETLLNYFLDQRDGLLLLSPVYAGGLLGLAYGCLRGRNVFRVAALLMAAHVGFYAFSTIRGGFSPPARPIASVVWVLALGLPVAWDRLGRWGRNALLIAGTWSVLLPWWMASIPPSIYQSTNRDTPVRAGLIFEYLSNLWIYLPDFLPSYPKGVTGSWLPNYVWGLSLTVVGIFILIRWARSRTPGLNDEDGPTVARSSPLVRPLWWAAGLAVVLLTSAQPRIVPALYRFLPLGDGSIEVGVPRDRCISRSLSAHAWLIACPPRPRWDFLVRVHRRPPSSDRPAIVAHLACRTPGRSLRYDLFWGDRRLSTVQANEQARRYGPFRLHPLYPAEDTAWGRIRLQAQDSAALACRNIHLVLQGVTTDGVANYRLDRQATQ